MGMKCDHEAFTRENMKVLKQIEGIDWLGMAEKMTEDKFSMLFECIKKDTMRDKRKNNEL
jgi:hypothetical protein